MKAPTVWLRPHPLRRTLEQLNALHDEWKFNCGPASICAVTGLTPEQLRPHMLDFESRGYTNPTLMFAVLRSLGIRFEVRHFKEHQAGAVEQALRWPLFGLVRIQWGGSWMKPSVPERARYRHTHWVATAQRGSSLDQEGLVGHGVFDVNAVANGSGWIAFDDWKNELVPSLIKEAVPKGDGTWSIAHSVELLGLVVP